MKRGELKRKTPLARKTELRAAGIDRPPSPSSATMGSADPGDTGRGKTGRQRASTLKPGRGFAASAAQREKVRGMACVVCGAMADDFTVIDPAHLCARGMGGCDAPECVVPLCRMYGVAGCHRAFDAGELDLAPFLEPAFREEVAHCVMHLGLEGTRVRLCPSLYRVRAGEAEAA